MAITTEQYPDQVERRAGLSTDTKPTGLPVGSIFWEHDTNDVYKTYDGTNWAFFFHAADPSASLTTYDQETASAVTVNGTTWADLLDKSTITKFTEIWGIKVTKGGTWAGSAKLRITNGAGTTKIYPFASEAVEGTDFVDTIVWMFPAPVCVTIKDGYKIQFRSSSASDGSGETLTLDELDIIERG